MLPLCFYSLLLLRRFRLRPVILFWMLVQVAPLAAQQESLRIDRDGTVHITDLSVPLSGFLSPESRDCMLELLLKKPFSGGPTAEEGIKIVNPACYQR